MGVNSALRMLGKLSKNADEVIESGAKFTTKGNVIKNVTNQLDSNLTRNQAKTMRNAGREMVENVRNEPKRVAQNVVNSRTANAAINNHNSSATRELAENMVHPEVAATSNWNRRGGNRGGNNGYNNRYNNRNQRQGRINFNNSNTRTPNQQVPNGRNTSQVINNANANANQTANINLNNHSTSNAINTLNNAINNTNIPQYHNAVNYRSNDMYTPKNIRNNYQNRIEIPENARANFGFEGTDVGSLVTSNIDDLRDPRRIQDLGNTKIGNGPIDINGIDMNTQIIDDNIINFKNTVPMSNGANINNVQGQNIDDLRDPRRIVNMNTFKDPNLSGGPRNLDTLNQKHLKINEIDDAVNFAPDNREPLKFNFDGVKGFADEYLLGGFKDTYKAFRNGGDDMTFGKALSAGFQNDDGSLRWGRVAGAYVTASAGLRLLSGGGLTHDRNGNPNVIGVPFV